MADVVQIRIGDLTMDLCEIFGLSCRNLELGVIMLAAVYKQHDCVFPRLRETNILKSNSDLRSRGLQRKGDSVRRGRLRRCQTNSLSISYLGTDSILTFARSRQKHEHQSFQRLPKLLDQNTDVGHGSIESDEGRHPPSFKSNVFAEKTVGYSGKRHESSYVVSACQRRTQHAVRRQVQSTQTQLAG